MKRAIFVMIYIVYTLSCSFESTPIHEGVNLPDPFLLESGARVQNEAEWATRRTELLEQIQEIQYGEVPEAPSAVTGTVGQGTYGNYIRVTCSDGTDNISFDNYISYPQSGTGPFPAVIAYGYTGMSSIFTDMGIAVINFPNNTVAAQANAGSRGQGVFYDLYGSGHSAGAIAAWSWGVSRLIDALEETPAANIDTSYLGVTGCSRNGKGALAAGVFDERIALTIVQESGAGGAASYRVSQAQIKSGVNVQSLSSVAGENCWFRTGFVDYGSRVDDLPYDQHTVMGLIAPRGLLVIENTSMEWLGNLSTWVSGNAAHSVWEALGVPQNMGYSQVGHGNHCTLPSSQVPEVEAFSRKFLLGDTSVNTSVMKTDGGFGYSAGDWTDWIVPSLN